MNDAKQLELLAWVTGNLKCTYFPAALLGLMNGCARMHPEWTFWQVLEHCREESREATPERVLAQAREAHHEEC